MCQFIWYGGGTKWTDLSVQTNIQIIQLQQTCRDWAVPMQRPGKLAGKTWKHHRGLFLNGKGLEAWRHPWIYRSGFFVKMSQSEDIMCLNELEAFKSLMYGLGENVSLALFRTWWEGSHKEKWCVTHAEFRVHTEEPNGFVLKYKAFMYTVNSGLMSSYRNRDG